MKIYRLFFFFSLRTPLKIRQHTIRYVRLRHGRGRGILPKINGPTMASNRYDAIWRPSLLIEGI